MERIILTEADADEFLGSIGVTLFEDSMTIGEIDVSGVVGQAALQEYGIFLYEDSILVEGEQAEKYLKKKMDEDNANIEREYKQNKKYNPTDEYEDRNHGQRGHETAKAGVTASMNPKHNTAIEIQQHRAKYNRVMPSTYSSKNNKEVRYNRDIEREGDIATLAKDMVDREKYNRCYDWSERKKHPGLKEIDQPIPISKRYNIPNSDEYNKIVGQNRYNSALDATRRHIRRELRKYGESAGIFSSINFI